jgi:hypothetical protein
MAKDSQKILLENIQRIKEVSGIYEDDSELAQIADDPKFEADLETQLKRVMDDTVKDLPNLGKKVGDKDGELEIEESMQISEAGLGMLLGGAALAAPKIIDMMGKGLAQVGKRVDSETLKKFGEKTSKVGHKIHHAYEGTVAAGLKKLYPNKSEEFYKGAATAIILAATVALGISSVQTAVGAAQAGKAGLAAIEGGLGGVKGAEIFAAAKEFLPKVLSGIIK